MQNFTTSKAITLSLIFIFIFISTLGLAQTVFIPDPNFKAALLADPNINWDGDGEIQYEEAFNFYGGIYVADKNIEDLTGIGYFYNARFLDCSNNQLTTLDLRGNGELVVHCQNNRLTSLLLGSYVNGVNCENNELTSLNLTGAYYIGSLNCQNNKLTQLTLSQGLGSYPFFNSLFCNNNQLTSLELKGMSDLLDLRCQNNMLTSLNTNYSDRIQSLDCSSNRLTSLNIQNIKPAVFNAINNPDLACVQVNDLVYAQANWNDHVDAGVSFSNDCSGTQIVHIPDTTFKATLLRNSTININGDGEIQIVEAEVVTSLNVPNQNIANLTGIGAFVSLTNLNCSGNRLTSLDLRSNKNLTQLRAFDNQLATLNVNGLTQLDLLRCNNNQLTALDLTSNTVLTSLRCEENKLTSLNVGANRLLMELDCSTNELTYLNVRNGNNINFTVFKAEGNPNIACLEVDDVAYAQANWGSRVDLGISFSTNCFVNIPDPKFKAALVGNFGINTNRDSEIHITEAQAYKGAINVSFKNIASLTGIEAFTAITSLNCRVNKLTSLDVQSNTKLTFLDCYYNQIPELDVRNNTALVTLNCGVNRLSSLDVSLNTKLNDLDCDNNQLRQLNVGPNTLLTKLNCGANQLTTLDISSNPRLVELNFGSNPITSIDVRHLSNLKVLLCDNAFLDQLDVTANPGLQGLSCSGNRLTSLDLSTNTNLENLYCIRNQLTSLDVSASTKISSLECQYNQLTSLKTGNHIFEIWCHDNKLTSLSVEVDNLFCQRNELTSLEGSIIHTIVQCEYNKFVNLDLSASKDLGWVSCDHNDQLVTLNIQNGNNITMHGFNATNNPKLTCVQVDDVAFAEANWSTYVDPGVMFSTNCGQPAFSADATSRSVSVFPNPTSGTLTINSTDEILGVMLYDAITSEPVNIPYQNNEADLNNLREGVYLIKIQHGRSVSSFKVVKK